ncbi:hypothetical protein PYCCODRAFT_456431 [Trametes coccinea BRFM310]|uniref:Uncharacterized protein n=1 Tax=Trametes coccinea (strain BRFM310) TaxID=1353009 RepID=A0A1Y2IMJ7_TRAC3|nr:hypothetical protein PYCCODRAFT_456431 [Trametes coccinea BRFM310]
MRHRRPASLRLRLRLEPTPKRSPGNNDGNLNGTVPHRNIAPHHTVLRPSSSPPSFPHSPVLRRTFQDRPSRLQLLERRPQPRRPSPGLPDSRQRIAPVAAGHVAPRILPLTLPVLAVVLRLALLVVVRSGQTAGRALARGGVRARATRVGRGGECGGFGAGTGAPVSVPEVVRVPFARDAPAADVRLRLGGRTLDLVRVVLGRAPRRRRGVVLRKVLLLMLLLCLRRRCVRVRRGHRRLGVALVVLEVGLRRVLRESHRGCWAERAARKAAWGRREWGCNRRDRGGQGRR